MKTLFTAFIFTSSISSLFAQQKPAFDLKASIGRGKEIYQAQCMTCHQEAGDGIQGVYPPLAKSDYLMADKKRSVQQILSGVRGPIKVKGSAYDAEMTGFDMNDQELSDLLNYIRNSWGNKGDGIRPEDVRALRK